MAARSRHELDGGLRRAAGRNQVVDQQHARAFVNGVGMNFDRIGSIFKIVFLADGLPRQLALLAHRHETKSELMGNRTTENEATRFDPGPQVERRAAVKLHQLLDRRADTFSRSAARRGGNEWVNTCSSSG